MQRKKTPVSKQISLFIKSWDLFGKQIEFNYQKEGTYKTLIGGAMSLMIHLFVGYVLYTRVMEMINSSRPLISLDHQL